ncbi:hypothetical protein C8R45DRAFT_1183127 [Mycena sanguinolenta]|nr:hypothetical protein C8R45DRAFT_1183127 [Mycena sanguinolenta]
MEPSDEREPDNASTPDANRKPPPMGPQGQIVLEILEHMHSKGITLADLLDAISWGDQDCTWNYIIRTHRTRLLNSPQLPNILRRWWKPPRAPSGKKRRPHGAKTAMEAFAFECVQEILGCELDNLEPIFKSPAGEDIKEENLTSISFPKLASEVKESAPNLWAVLFRLSRTESQQRRSPRKNPATIIIIIVSIFSYTRSHHRGRLQKLFAIYFKFRGLSAKGFDTLHALGLTMSNKWTGNAVSRISAAATAKMKDLMDSFPWLMSYDNVRITFRVFAQRVDSNTIHGNGTAGTVYIKRSAKPLLSTINQALKDMRLAGMANPLTALDIFDLAEAADTRRYPHTVYLVLRYLFDAPDFNFATFKLVIIHCCNDQPQFGSSKASYDDNSKLIDEWLRQLGLSTPELREKIGLQEVMTWVGDQLTVDRLRNLFRFRSEDDNSFERLDWLVVSPGWLHIQMAFANSLHKQHLGTGNGRRLSAAFDVLARRGLQTSHTEDVFFHDLSEVLHIAAEAQVRELWLQVGKVESLAALPKLEPQALVTMAEKIVAHHASNNALTQSIMFLRDVFPFIILWSAVRTGDIGIMEDMIPLMLYRFVGGKNSNYSGEMLELLQGLNREWPPELSEFIRKNCWAINNTTRPNGFMAVDEAQEMNIKDIKVTYRSEGPNIDWAFIRKLHPAIHVIRAVNGHIETQFKTRVRGSKHTIPKKELDIQELQKWYRASDVHVLEPGRVVKRGAKKTSPDVPKDVIAKGATTIQLGKALPNWIETRSIHRATTENWEAIDSDEGE